MYQAGIYKATFQTSDFVSKSTIRKSLLRCSCGRATYLSRPCGYCGSNTRKSFYESKKNNPFLKYSLGMILIPMLISIVLVCILWRFTWAIPLIILAGVLTWRAWDHYQKTDKDLLDDFLFLHDCDASMLKKYRKRNSNISAVDSKVLETVVDAYYYDLGRLEQLAYSMDMSSIQDRDTWIGILTDAQRLAHIFSNNRIARLQFRIMMHVNPQDFMLTDVNHVCAFLTIADVLADQLWKAQHFLGDYLLLAAQTDCDAVKRMFDLTTIALIHKRYSDYGKPDIPYDQQEIMNDIQFICGSEVFEKAWPDQEKPVVNGVVHVPKDVDGMKRLAGELQNYVRMNHNRLISSDAWWRLLLDIYSLKDVSMKKIGAAIEYQYGFGWTAHLNTAQKKQLASLRPKGYKNIYTAWRDYGLNKLKPSVLTLLLPEEMIYVSRVWNHCLYNEAGICYYDLTDFQIGSLLKFFSKDSEINQKLLSGWRAAKQSLHEIVEGV